MPRRTRYDKSLKLAKRYEHASKFFGTAMRWVGVLFEARSMGMKTGENHLWYRVALGDDEVSIINMEDFDMAKERRVPIEDAPEWMLKKIALLKLANPLQGAVDVSLGGRVGDVFYIRREDENDGE